jgi:hypothetical protein
MIDWMESGRGYTKGKEAEMQKIFSEVEWQEFQPGKKEGFMPATSISEIIRQTNRKPLRYAISHALAPMGLYGIEFNYKDATVKSYWVDDGVICSCLAAEPTYKKER